MQAIIVFYHPPGPPPEEKPEETQKAELARAKAEAAAKAAEEAKLIVTVEEHSPFGGLGSMVAQTVAAECPKKVINLALPDAPVITGTSKEVFKHYGLDAEGISGTVLQNL